MKIHIDIESKTHGTIERVFGITETMNFPTENIDWNQHINDMIDSLKERKLENYDSK